MTNSMNFNHKMMREIKSNNTQRPYTESLGLSPKKGVNMVPIQAKQSLDSFDQENTLGVIYADTILDKKKRKQQEYN